MLGEEIRRGLCAEAERHSGSLAFSSPFLQRVPLYVCSVRVRVPILLQRRIQPVRLGRAISVTFVRLSSPLRVRYCKRDEVYFTTLQWQNNGRQNGLISWMLFSELYKIMVKKAALAGFRGGRSPPLDPPLSCCDSWPVCWRPKNISMSSVSMEPLSTIVCCKLAILNVSVPLQRVVITIVSF